MKLLRTFFAAKSSLVRLVPLMRDQRVPATLKIATLALGVLVISPIDLLGDIPVLGLIDDAALLSLLAYGFVQLAVRATASVPARALIPPERR